jgi:aspartyl protease family protein
MRRLLLLSSWLCVALSAAAQSVALQGRMGSSQALLVIDGQAQVVGIGQTVAGVRLLSVDEGQADVMVGGQRRTLMLGTQPSRVGGDRSIGGGREIVLFAGRGGHFNGNLRVNGRWVPFIVDTGATTVAIPRNLAAQLGIEVKGPPTGWGQTANGVVPFYRVTLSSVRIGDVEIANVVADVLPADMQHVLLGNSYLTRFQMSRVNDTLRLTLR